MAIAPLIPEGGLSVGLILLAVACVFLLALNKAWQWTIGAMLRALADMVSSLPHVTILGHKVPPWDALAGGFGSIDSYVLAGIGAGITWTEKGLHAVLGAMSWLLQETADQLAGLAEDTAKALEWVKHVAIPTATNAATEGILRRLRLLEAEVEALLSRPVAAVHTTVRVLAPGLAHVEGQLKALEAKVASIGAAAPSIAITPDVTRPRVPALPGVKDIYNGLDSLWKDVKRIGKVVTPAGIVGLVAGSVLSTMHLSWLKCGNWQRFGKQVCGTNPDALAALLTGLISVFGTLSIVKFAEDVQGLTGTASDEVASFWRATSPGPGGDRVLGQKSA